MDGDAQTTVAAPFEAGPTDVLAGRAAPPDWRKHALGLVVALVVGLAVRLWWLGAVDTQPVTDFDWYFERAKGIVQGLGYSVDGDPTAYWPVGYPGTLAVLFRLFGATVLVGKVFNTVLTLAAVVLAWRLALRLFYDHRVANLAALALAVHPAYVAYSGILASEPLYTALTLFATTVCLLGPREDRNWGLTAGAAFGLATLVRPQAVLVPVIVVLFARWRDARDRYRGQTLRALILVAVVMAVVVAPWMYRNQAVFGRPVFVSTNGGDNLLIGNNPKADGRYHSPDDLGYGLSNFGEADRDRKATRLAVTYALANKRKTLSLWPAKLSGTFLSGTDAPYWAFQKTKGKLAPPGTGSDKALYKGFQAYSVAFTSWLLALAGLGVVVTLIGRRYARLPATGLALIAYSAVLSVVFFGNPRFAFPVVPFLAMHAAQGVVVAWEWVRRVRRVRQVGTQANPTAGSQSS